MSVYGGSVVVEVFGKAEALNGELVAVFVTAAGHIGDGWQSGEVEGLVLVES